MKKRWIALAAIGALAAGTVSWGAAANDVEQPEYKIVSSQDNIEIREYGEMIVAEATVTGNRDSAMSKGFRTIADYIFGNNVSSEEIAMTSPVTQKAVGQEIAMTAPVTQTKTDNAWQVRFIMPSEYTMDTLPKPVNPDVELKMIPSRRFAAIRFSGRGGMEMMQQRTAELQTFLDANGLTAVSDPTYAFYDGPWVPGPFRRNEVMIEVTSE